MADRRRRRANIDHEEVLSEGESQHHNSLSLTQSVHDYDEDYGDLSEYESAEEEEEVSEHSDTEDETKAAAHKEEDADLNISRNVNRNEEQVYEEDVVTREQGDGQEQSDDADSTSLKIKENKDEENLPTFIPTKGQFFQHDVRNDENSRGGKSNRGFRDSDKSRWLHDKFDEIDQTPKCKAQLIAEYGYDIRAFDYNSGPNYSRGQRGGGKRRPINRRGISRSQYNQQPQREQSSKNKETVSTSNQQEWPELNQPSKPEKSQPIKSQNFHSSKQNKPADDNYKKSNRQPYPERRAADIEVSNKKESSHQNENKNKSPSSSKKKQNTENNLETMLNVIDKHEKSKRQQQQQPPRDKSYSHQRHGRKYEENLSDRIKNVSVSGSKESNQPRRYSSLRQKAVETSVDHQRQPVLPPEWSKSKSENKQQPKVAPAQNKPSPVQYEQKEQQPVVTNQTPPLMHGSPHSVSTPPINQYEPEQAHEITNMSEPMGMPPNIVGLANHVMSIPKSDVLLSGMDPALASMQYYETYQQQQRMMSTLTPPSHLSSMMPQQQQPVLNIQALEQMHHNNMLMTSSEEHKITSPPRSHINTLPNAGDLTGSLTFPPPLPHNFPPNTYMPRNVLQEPPQLPPLPFPPNHHLLGQQVHGVTYYTQPNVPNMGISPDGSPIRKLNSNAIPIRPPLHYNKMM